jgi:SsrA-binding protein
MQALQNRQALYDYFIETRYQAGMALLGTEVKSLREGKASFNDSFCVVQQGEVFIKSLHIAPYSHGTHSNHEPLRDRKLLLSKKEITKIAAALKEKGYTLVPLRIFFSEKGLIKIEIGLGKGKKQYDKRDSIKKREAEREIKRNAV